MRRDVQEIFRLTPHEKQCMMFSATLSKEIRPVCRKFMQDVSTQRCDLPVASSTYVLHGNLYNSWYFFLSPWKCLWMMRPS